MKFPTVPLLAWVLVASSALAADEAPSADAAPKGPAAPQDLIELSPFVVKEESDNGYMVRNSLAGTRLNTPLRDSAASISVLNSDFLNDIGALDLTSALAYAPNVQNELSEEGAPGTRLVEFYTQYRVRGVPASAARNYFVWKLPMDNYNVDRVEESRGPNSILFGVGSAGGIINSATKQPVMGKSFDNVAYAFDSNGSKRVTGDFNRTADNRRAGIRVNLLSDDQESARLFAYRKEIASHISTVWEPFHRTTVRAEGEVGHLTDTQPRPWTFLDRVAVWDSNGRPTYATPTTNTAAGVNRFATATNRITYIENLSSLLDEKGTMQTVNPINSQLAITDPKIADYSVNPAGPNARRDTDFTTVTVSADQQIGDRTFLQLAYNRQHYDFVGYDPDTTAHQLFGDPNQLLPTGQANPFAKRYYIDSSWYRRWRTETNEALRLTASTSVDLKAFGNYRFAALAERDNNAFQRTEKREVWAGAPFGGNLNATQNLVYRRTYVDEGNWSTYRLNGGKGQLITNLVDPVTGRTLNSTWLQGNINIDDDPSYLRSYMLATEARYWQDRIVAVVGVRQDKLTLVDRGTLRPNNSSEVVVDYGNVNIGRYSANTESLGLVAHATSWLSFHYNQSNNSDLPNVATTILPNGNRSSGARGTGRDFGFTLNFGKDRFYLKGTYYTTRYDHQADFASVNPLFVAPGNNILDALVSRNLISQADYDAHFARASAATTGRKSSGEEFEFGGNLTSRWRFLASFSINNLVTYNPAPEVVAWFNSQLPYWQKFDPAIITSTGDTIGQTIAQIQTNLQNQAATEGADANANRKYKASVFSRYTFGPGWLRGFYVGGGYRYQSGRLFRFSTTAGITTLYGNAIHNADALAGYRTKLWHDRYSLTVQLNVTNVFNFTDPDVTSLLVTGQVSRFAITPPRAFRLTTTVGF